MIRVRLILIDVDGERYAVEVYWWAVYWNTLGRIYSSREEDRGSTWSHFSGLNVLWVLDHPSHHCTKSEISIFEIPLKHTCHGCVWNWHRGRVGALWLISITCLVYMRGNPHLFLSRRFQLFFPMEMFPSLAELPCVSLRSYATAFWRPQHNHDDSHLATIEAIYYAMREYQVLFNNKVFYGLR